MIGAIMQLAQATQQAKSGAVNYVIAKDLGKAQLKSAKWQRDKNIAELNRVYEQEYENLIDGFIDNRLQIMTEAKQATDKLSLATAHIVGADMSESSFNYENIKSAINQEFLENLNTLNQVQIDRTSNLMIQKAGQIEQQEQVFDQAEMNIYLAEKQALLNLENAFIGASAQALSATAGGALGKGPQETLIGKPIQSLDGWKPNYELQFQSNLMDI